MKRENKERKEEEEEEAKKKGYQKMLLLDSPGGQIGGRNSRAIMARGPRISGKVSGVLDNNSTKSTFHASN